MIKLSDVSLQLGGKPLLSQASLNLYAGERVAVVGANGAGKTTLFRLLKGELQADSGDCTLPSSWRMSYMEQEITEVDRTALDFVLDGDAPLRQMEQTLRDAQNRQDDHAVAEALAALDNYRAFSKQAEAEQLLAGLGFKQDEFLQPLSAFSGGWRVRLSLARALMCPSDLMLLDEPTNHLDLHTCYWLENWLKQYAGTLMFISHDRDFMDGVATQVISFEQQKLPLYRGNYSQFERQRNERVAQQQAAYDRQEKQREHLETFVRRFKAKATKAKQAQSRVKMLERLTLNPPSLEHLNYDLRIESCEEVSDPLIRLDDLELGYGAHALLRKINLSLHAGMRLGLLGVNGAGKSTLIKALVGELQPLAGQITRGKHTRIGYFAQHQLEMLDSEASAFQHLRQLDKYATDQEIKNFVGRFGFPGERALERVGHFSGGEKARVALAMIAWQRPNLLILDEPTNHLDIDMRAALNMALQNYEGAVLLVSHDRYLLNATAEDLWWVREGEVHAYSGDLKDYFDHLLKAPKLDKASPAEKKTSSPDKKLQRQNRAANRKKLKPLQDSIKRSEKAMETLQKSLADIENQLADTQLYEAANKTELQAVLKRQGELREQLEQEEQAWLNAQEQLEAAEIDQDCG